MSFNYLSISAQQPAVWRRESRRDSRWCGECCGRVVIPNPYSKAKTRAQNFRKKLYVIRRLLTGLPLVQTSHDSAPGPGPASRRGNGKGRWGRPFFGSQRCCRHRDCQLCCPGVSPAYT